MVNNYISLLGLKRKVFGLLVFGCKYTGYLFIPLFVMLHLFFFMLLYVYERTHNRESKRII